MSQCVSLLKFFTSIPVDSVCEASLHQFSFKDIPVCTSWGEVHVVHCSPSGSRVHQVLPPQHDLHRGHQLQHELHQ